MTETTLDEARRCPKCQEPGEAGGVRAAPRSPGIARGTMLHTFYCRNSRCVWNGEVCRIIQVNPDGSIPPARTGREPKNFPALPYSPGAVAGLEQQVYLETHGGGEITNR